MPPTNPSKPVSKGTHDRVCALKELDRDNTDAKTFKLVRRIIDFLPILFIYKLSCKMRLSSVVRQGHGLLGLKMDAVTTAGAMGGAPTLPQLPLSPWGRAQPP